MVKKRKERGDGGEREVESLKGKGKIKIAVIMKIKKITKIVK